MNVVSIYEGHYDEITKLAIVGEYIISASLDGSIRMWDIHKPPPRLETEAKQELQKESMLTEEEERELAELMSDDVAD